VLKKKIRFFVIRIKHSTLKELIYRTKQFLLIIKLYLFPKKIVIPYHSKNKNIINNIALPDLQYNFNIEKTKNFSEHNLGKLYPGFFKTPLNEKKFSKLFFSKINYRYAKSDIRIIWENSRLQEITKFLFLITKNPGENLNNIIKEKCKISILSWIDKNPFLYGPNYISVMECSLRIPVFFYCLKTLNNLKPLEFEIILKTIYLHAWWVSKRLSLFSSLGNHTVAESVGLIFGGSIFCNHKDGQKWLSKGIQLLEEELPHQILEDGGPIEQSFHYHRFVIDLCWLAINFLEKNNHHECLKLKSRLILGEKFLLAFKAQNEQSLSIGDSDDGFAVAPGITPKKPVINYHKKKIRIFKNSGYTIINAPNGVQMTFHHGPLGMPPFYNHGHADALSIALDMNEKLVLVDPGTYRYNGAPEWRRYFKGTRAHNTITIDGYDQAIQETGFIWSHAYQVKLLGFSEHYGKFLIKAEHDGYKRLEKPVWHRRSVLFFDDYYFLIKDSFEGKGTHDFEINYHFHPDAGLIKKNSWWQISNGGAQIYMRLLENEDFLTTCGSTDPMHGWYSPRYGEKLKCNVMSYKKRGFPREISFVTAICTEAAIDLKKITDKLIYFD